MKGLNRSRNSQMLYDPQQDARQLTRRRLLESLPPAIREGVELSGEEDSVRPHHTSESEPRVTATAGTELAEYHQTDLGNARRLVDRHGNDLRFCASLGGRMIWGGGRWTRDETGEWDRRAKEITRAILVDAAGIDDDSASKGLAG